MRYSNNKHSYTQKISNRNGILLNSKASVAFSKSFFDPLLSDKNVDEYNVMLSVNSWQEYDLGVFPEEDIVTQKDTGMSMSTDFEEPYFVEAFEESYSESVSPLGNPRENKIELDNYKTVTTKSINNSPPSIVEDAKVEFDFDDEPSVPKSKKKDIEEDEFIRDMKAILTGTKKVEDTKMGATSKNDTQSSAPTNTPGPQDNRNAIFEQLSQSMKYANAYDLGDVDIEQRFNDFDVLSESKAKSSTQMPTDKTKQAVSNSKNHEKTHVSNEDFIVDLDDIIKAPSSIQMQEMSRANPSESGIGGVSILATDLLPGDIFISTTTSALSPAIKGTASLPVSHASIYLGDNLVAQVLNEGVITSTVSDYMAANTLSGAYRHNEMNPTKAAQVETFIREARNNNIDYNKYSLVRVQPTSLIENYCRTLPEPSRQRCIEQSSSFRLGTDVNNRFYCSKLIFEAFHLAGLAISTTQPQWDTPNDMVMIEHNNTLNYVGHLSTN